MITVTPDTRVARQYLLRLERQEIPRVIGRSLDRTRASVASAASRILRQRVALKKAVIDQSIKTRRSGEVQSLAALNFGRAWFEVRFRGKPIPIRDYEARQVRSGVSYRVSKQAGRKKYTRNGQPAFFVRKFGNHVFTRTGPDPAGPDTVSIRKAFGPSLPQFAATRKLQQPLIERARQVWAAEVIRNSRFALNRRR